MYRTISLDTPNLGPLEKRYLNKTIDEGFVSTFGPYVSEFEKKFAQYLDANMAVSTQSGTAALHVALHELGIGKKDEVIVPALTFVATVNPIAYVGAKPVFVDVDINTWCINPDLLEEKITKKTKAIIPVHLYGNACDMDKIMKIAKKHNLYVVEDATESLGTKYGQKYTGTFGDLGCFSFNGNKTITTGGGGIVLGNDKKRMRHIKFLVNQARSESLSYYHSEIGFNYRMTNLEAALGLAQMKRLGGFLSKKKKLHNIYEREFEGTAGIFIQEGYEKAESSRWFSCAIFESRTDMNTLQNKLKKKGVPTRRVFMPVTEFPPYRQNKKGNYKNSHYIYERGLCLPSSTVNSEDDIRYICRCIKELL